MAFRKYHGITLANNSWVENLHVERLASDPSPLVAGRVWFNDTDKVLRFSSLDGVGAVVTIDVASGASLSALTSLVNTINGDSNTAGSFRKEIADVVAAAPEALNTLQEIAAAMNNDPNLYDTLVNLVNTSISDLNDQILGTATTAMDTLGEVEAALGDKTTLTTTDKSTFVAAINEVVASVTAEASARVAADAAIQAELDATQGGAGLGTDGTYTANGAMNYIATATSLKDADEQLDAALKAEVDRAVAAEQGLQTQIDNAGTSNSNARAAIQSELDATQAGAGLGTDGTYQSRTGTNYLDTATSLADEATKLDVALKAEADRAIAAEGANATAISNETARAQAVEGSLAALTTADKTDLVSAINEVAGLAGEGNAALIADINAKKAIYTAGSAQLTHTFNHGLAGADLDVTVWVYDSGNSKWYNDSVMVEMDPATTTVIVPLQVAAVIKIIVEDISDLS